MHPPPPLPSPPKIKTHCKGVKGSNNKLHNKSKTKTRKNCYQTFHIVTDNNELEVLPSSSSSSSSGSGSGSGSGFGFGLVLGATCLVVAPFLAEVEWGKKEKKIEVYIQF